MKAMQPIHNIYALPINHLMIGRLQKKCENIAARIRADLEFYYSIHASKIGSG
jgi:hypothetical protein